MGWDWHGGPGGNPLTGCGLLVGPFVRRSTLEAALPSFLDDLRSESPASLVHQLLQTRRGEPLTEAPDIDGDTP